MDHGHVVGDHEKLCVRVYCIFVVSSNVFILTPFLLIQIHVYGILILKIAAPKTISRESAMAQRGTC